MLLPRTRVSRLRGKSNGSGRVARGAAKDGPVFGAVLVLPAHLAQIPDHLRRGTPILVRTDTAGCTKAFLAHIRDLRTTGCDVRFSVGAPIDETVREAIRRLPDTVWYPAIDTSGHVRDGAWVADLTGLLPADDRFPAGTQFILRRERPHPGAQLDLFDTVEGFRHQLIATDSPAGSGHLTWLDARHRAHARVEDRIRCGKDTGFGRFPFRVFAIVISARWRIRAARRLPAASRRPRPTRQDGGCSERTEWEP